MRDITIFVTGGVAQRYRWQSKQIRRGRDLERNSRGRFTLTKNGKPVLGRVAGTGTASLEALQEPCYG